MKAKKVISVSIDIGLYKRLMKVLESDDSAKLSNIINNAIKSTISGTEAMYAQIKKIRQALKLT